MKEEEHLVIFQNYFSPYRHKLFVEIAKAVKLTVIYMQKPQEEGRKWEEALFSTGKNYESLQLQNKRLFPIKPLSQIVWVTGLKKLQEVIPDTAKVIFLDNMPTNFTMLRIIKSIGNRIPRKNRYLWNEHILPKGEDSGLKNMYKKFMTTLLAIQVDTIISFSEMTTEYLKSLRIPLTGQTVIRAFQATYGEEEIKGMKEQVEKQVQKGQEILTFGFLGYFSSRKGINEFLSAIKCYGNKKARFVFVGDGPSREKIEAAAKLDSRILLKPYAVSEEEKTEYFSEMTVHVAPSEKDPWCVVVNEAACRGVPSLVSPNVGSKELVALIDKSFILTNNQGFTLAKAFSEIEHRFETRVEWKELRDKTFKIASLWNIEQAATPFTELFR